MAKLRSFQVLVILSGCGGESDWRIEQLQPADVEHAPVLVPPEGSAGNPARGTTGAPAPERVSPPGRPDGQGGSSTTRATAGSSGAGGASGICATCASGGGGSADTLPVIPEWSGHIVSNAPNATFDVAGVPTGALRLLSSNFSQLNFDDGLGSQYVWQWFGELENTGSYPFCDLLGLALEVDGVEIDLTAALSGSPFHIGETAIVNQCIPVGAHGVAFWADYSDVPFDPTRINHVSLHWVDTGLGARARPAAAPVILSMSAREQWIEGVVQGALEPTYAVGLGFYIRDPAGLVTERIGATRLETLSPGDTWTFQTTAASGAIGSFLHSFSFVLGTAPELQD
jgi:hypothetical protein